MPSYTVQTDQGSYNVELDSEPESDSQLQSLVSEHLGAQPKESSLDKGLKNVTENLKGAGETLAHVGSSFAAFPASAGVYVGGLAHQGLRFLNRKAFPLPKGVPDEEPVDFTKPEEEMGKVSEALTYQPKTELGKMGGGIIDYPFEKLSEGIDIAAKKITKNPTGQSLIRGVTGIVAPLAIGGAAGPLVKGSVRSTGWNIGTFREQGAKLFKRGKEAPKIEEPTKPPAEGEISPQEARGKEISTPSIEGEVSEEPIPEQKAPTDISLEELPKIDHKELARRIDQLMEDVNPDILKPSDYEIREILAGRVPDNLDISAKELHDLIKNAEDFKPHASPEEKFRAFLGLPSEEELLQQEEAQGRSREEIDRRHAAIKTMIASEDLKKGNQPPPEEPPPENVPRGTPPFGGGPAEPGGATIPSSLAAFEKDYLTQMEHDLVAGQSNALAQPRMMDFNQERVPIPSTNPDWFKNMGEAKSNVFKMIMKAKNDIPLTPKQSVILREMLERKKEEVRRREDSANWNQAEKEHRQKVALNEFMTMEEEPTSLKTPSKEEPKPEVKKPLFLKKQGDLVGGHEVPKAKIRTGQGYGEAERPGTLFEEGGPNAEAKGQAEFKKNQGGFFGNQRGAAKLDLLTMGAEQFAKQDLAPGVRDIVTGLRDSTDEILKVFNPMARGDSAKRGAETIRSALGEMMRSYNQAEHTLGEMDKYFEKIPTERQIEFQRRMDENLDQANPGETAMAHILRKLLDQKLEEVRALGTGKLQTVVENYFPRFWKDKVLATQIFGKRPMQGSRTFLKPRTLKYFSEGLAKGLEPEFPNPVKAVLAHVYEVNRYLAAEKAFKQNKIDKLAKFIPAGYSAPHDWVSPKDPMFTVYGDPSVHLRDTMDKQIYSGLNKLAEDLGVPHERLFQLKGDKLGLAYKAPQGGPSGKIQTRFASPESVVAHELGHILDFKYGLQDLLMKNPDKKIRIPMNKELRKLADQNWAKLQDVPPSFKKYVRKGPEKMAVILESYIHAPELLKETAPTVYKVYTDFLDAHPELAPLKEIKPGLTFETVHAKQTLQGMLIRGHWYVPKELGTVYNNFLDPGLRTHASFRGYLGIANVLNQFQLGLSGFHLGFTSLDAVISKVALGVLQTSQGQFKKAGQSFLEAPAAPVLNILRGDKLMKAWMDPTNASPEMKLLADALQIAGGRVKMDNFYKTHISQHMVEAFKQGNIIGGIVRAPFALVEQASRPIMEELVPRQKLGVFADLAKHEMLRLVDEGATPREVQQALMKIWDSVDNRMGQLVYDNLFWNKTAKDLAMGSVRSLGWNLGDFRELGGAVTDSLAQTKQLGTSMVEMAKGKEGVWEQKKLEMTYRQSYAIALPVTVGILGAIATYLMTGEGPKDLKDYYFPRTGNLDQNGLPERVSFPSYMKDVYAYYNDAFRTLTNKLNPAIALAHEMLTNKDYYGTKIRNEDDPLIQQLLSVAGHVGKTFEPFSFRGMQKLGEEGAGPIKKMLPQIGIVPAPSDLNKTAAEDMASRLAHEKFTMGSRTKEQADRAKMIHNFAGRLANKDPNVKEEIKAAKVSSQDLDKIIERSRSRPLQAWAKMLDYPELTRVWKVATPEEKKKIQSILVDKGINYAVEFKKPEIKQQIREMIKQ
jgi:hypothetical protein